MKLFRILLVAFSLTLTPTVSHSAPRHHVHHIVLNVEVTDESVKAVEDQIDEANDEGDEAIILEINSPGGSVPDGFELAKHMEASKAPVICVVDGEAASMAAYLLEAGAVRVMTTRSTVMFHQPAMGGRFQGQPNDWQSIADWLKAMEDAMIEHCRARMVGVSFEYFKAKIAGGAMWWLAWREAEHIHAVDAVVPSVAYAEAHYRELLKLAP